MVKSKRGEGLYIPAPYTKIPDGMMLSKEFNKLKPTARCVYLIMLAKWDPYQPEEAFALPYEEAELLTGFSSNTISNAIKDLMTGGYIKIPQKGRYPNNVSLYKIDLVQLQKKYPKNRRGKATWPEYIARLRSGVE